MKCSKIKYIERLSFEYKLVVSLSWRWILHILMVHFGISERQHDTGRLSQEVAISTPCKNTIKSVIPVLNRAVVNSCNLLVFSASF